MLSKIYNNSLFCHALFLAFRIFRREHVLSFRGRSIRNFFLRVRICSHICVHIYVLDVLRTSCDSNRHEECYKGIRRLLDIDCTSLVPPTSSIRTDHQICAATQQLRIGGCVLESRQSQCGTPKYVGILRFVIVLVRWGWLKIRTQLRPLGRVNVLLN